MSHLTDEQLESLKIEAASEIVAIVQQMAKDYPGVNEGLGTVIGTTAGAGFSFTALTLLGVKGLSAAGITSGLATAGGVVGGGMVAGIGVLAAPIAIAGVIGYAYAKKKKSAKFADDLKQSIIKLYKIQERLTHNAEYFKNELDELKTKIEYYKNIENSFHKSQNANGFVERAKGFFSKDKQA